MALHEQCVGKTDEWYTPPHVFDALGMSFDVDVASPGKDITPWIPATRFITTKSLESRWEGSVWRYPSKRAKFPHKRQQTIKLCTAAEAKRMGFRGPKPGETRLIPIEYDDPEKQAGFEHAYRGREFLLR